MYNIIMKKRLFIIGMILLSILLSPKAQAMDVSERTTIEKIPALLNFVITRPSDQTQWLIKMKKGCSNFKEGQEVQLVMREALNGNNDYLKVDNQPACGIEKAYQFNGELLVDYAYNNEAQVIDEKERHYSIFHVMGCAQLRSHLQEKVYVLRQGDELNEGDILFVPGDPDQCSIRLVEKLPAPKKEAEDPNKDTKRPTRVANVRAIPQNGQAFVYWHSAEDNVGIDHYVVSYSKYRSDPKNIMTGSAENQTVSTDTKMTIKGLENDQMYYFYILAVDTSGNESSFWSPSASAFVKSSIMPAPVVNTQGPKLNLHKVNETKTSITFEWDNPPTTTRYLVTLRTITRKSKITDFGFNEYASTRIKILKTPSRRGKNLELKVSAFNTKDFIGEETMEFRF